MIFLFLGRLYFGFHHVADVVAGFLVGMVSSIVASFFIGEFTLVTSIVSYILFAAIHRLLVDRKKLYEEYDTSVVARTSEPPSSAKKAD